MTETRPLLQIAAAASVAAHVAVVVALVLSAGARPFETASTPAIAVDLVAPDDITPPQPAATPTEPPTAAPELDLKPPLDASRSPEPSSSASSAPPPSADATPQQAAAQPPAAAPAYTPPQPDLTVKYGVMLGLPDSTGKSDFDAAATDSADLAATDIAAFRRHLRNCATMPDSIDPDDDVWIKLRAAFAADGRLAAPPALIEGKASPKALALARGAIAALQACQPYAMLPPDRYDEWKVLDLAFTPRDFTRN